MIEAQRPEGLSDQGWLVLNELHDATMNNPEVLLETEGGGVGGDVVWALLIGHDDQHEHLWRLPRLEPELQVAIIPRQTLLMDGDPCAPSYGTASYRPTNMAARMRLAQPYMVEAFGVTDPMGGTVSLVRYKRQVDTP